MTGISHARQDSGTSGFNSPTKATDSIDLSNRPGGVDLAKVLSLSALSLAAPDDHDNHHHHECSSSDTAAPPSETSECDQSTQDEEHSIPTGPAPQRRRPPIVLPRISPLHPAVLNKDDEDKLSEQMVELFVTELLPTPDSIEIRKKFIRKLEAMVCAEWPDHPIGVYVFGSTSNNLASSHSDVDICITTESEGLFDVRDLARLLKRHGMQRVYCVFAKVPIVRFWDPQLRLACDLNINNTVSLHNTRMIKTFVDVDPRVRPLAMVIKHWTRRRVLNDAAAGGTISPYTWINALFNFLQLRRPPILPVLHQPSPVWSAETHNSDEFQMSLDFNDNIEELVGFGQANRETLGRLLYEFFRYYAHDFSYRESVVSVRHGRLLTKREKDWDHGRFAGMFCVEEPFNERRNLGNSADADSLEGIRQELERAVEILERSADIDVLCEPFVLETSRGKGKPAVSMGRNRDAVSDPSVASTPAPRSYAKAASSPRQPATGQTGPTTVTSSNPRQGAGPHGLRSSHPVPAGAPRGGESRNGHRGPSHSTADRSNRKPLGRGTDASRFANTGGHHPNPRRRRDSTASHASSNGSSGTTGNRSRRNGGSQANRATGRPIQRQPRSAVSSARPSRSSSPSSTDISTNP